MSTTLPVLIRSGTAPPRQRTPWPRRTRSAPHVRDAISLNGVVNRLTLAMLPCAVIGIANTGYQANLAGTGSHLEARGWRAILLAGLGLGSDPSNPFDSLLHGLLYALPLFLVTLAVAWSWQKLFAVFRGQPAGESCWATALLFTLLLPPTAPFWQAALGISFGVVFAKEVFGGTGKNFVHPALAGLVFLYFSYPGPIAAEGHWPQLAGYGGTSLFAGVQASGLEILDQAGMTWRDSFLGFVAGPVGATSAAAAIVGGALLIGWRIVSWRILAGAVLGLIGTLHLFRLFSSTAGPIVSLPWYWHITLGSFAFAVVFLATDPVCSPMTERGAWIYGLLIGFMVVLIRAKNPLHPDGTLLAILLGNVFAPLIDSFFIWGNLRTRRRRVA